MHHKRTVESVQKVGYGGAQGDSRHELEAEQAVQRKAAIRGTEISMKAKSKPDINFRFLHYGTSYI